MLSNQGEKTKPDLENFYETFLCKNWYKNLFHVELKIF